MEFDLAPEDICELDTFTLE